MFQTFTKSIWLFLIGLIIGGIGAAGQAFLLHHELVDCYPYKVVDYSFYKGIADFGVYLALPIAIISGVAFGLKRWWLAIFVPVFSCPLLFAAVFKTISILREWNGVVSDWSFDGKTPETIAQGFFLYTISLASSSLIVGAICSLILWRLSMPKKLA